ncbi:MAG: flagellar basal body-associated FliL family protein [Bdellovibrionales bacterium]
MSTLRICFFIGVLVTGLSCSKKEISRKASSIHEAAFAEEIKAEPFIVRVQDGDVSKIMSLSLKYSGLKGLGKDLEGQKDAVQNLVISIISDYEFKQLKTKKGKEGFQKNILMSLNEFVAENKFTKVDVLKIEEI